VVHTLKDRGEVARWRLVSDTSGIMPSSTSCVSVARRGDVRLTGAVQETPHARRFTTRTETTITLRNGIQAS